MRWLSGSPGRVFEPELETKSKVRRRGLDANVMIASSNAITLDGRLVNLGGAGNLVAALAFGPEKVILVAHSPAGPILDGNLNFASHQGPSSPKSGLKSDLGSPFRCPQPKTQNRKN